MRVRKDDRLPACDKRHADVASEIVIDYSEGKTRRRCKVCMRVRAAEAYHRIDKIHTTATAYQELLPRLAWPAPEFIKL